MGKFPCHFLTVELFISFNNRKYKFPYAKLKLRIFQQNQGEEKIAIHYYENSV
jgi:hypothetical protein